MQDLTDSTATHLKKDIRSTINSNFTLYKILHNIHNKEIKKENDNQGQSEMNNYELMHLDLAEIMQQRFIDYMRDSIDIIQSIQHDIYKGISMHQSICQYDNGVFDQRN